MSLVLLTLQTVAQALMTITLEGLRDSLMSLDE
jgi:hypothetical protein